MQYKIYYNKGLKMSEGKLAAQVAHITLNIGIEFGIDVENDYRAGYSHPSISSLDQTIIVLGLSDTKFKEYLSFVEEYEYYHVQKDLGFTEVDEGTITAFGFIEEF